MFHPYSRGLHSLSYHQNFISRYLHAPVQAMMGMMVGAVKGMKGGKGQKGKGKGKGKWSKW
jgi:ABC-type transporter Mla maintaining outer membrane lipid asymmetry permease subunit MlaE